MSADPTQQQFQAMTQALLASHIPITRQRGRILELLAGNTRHPTAQDLLQALQPEQVSRATVYNTLNLLEKAGLLKVVCGVDNNLHFDPNCEHHHHLHCTQCGQLQDIPWEDLVVTHQGRAISVPVLFQGICKGCTSIPE